MTFRMDTLPRSNRFAIPFSLSPIPTPAEALALNFADNTDAKLQTITELFAGNYGNSGWLGFNRLLDSNVRMTTEL